MSSLAFLCCALAAYLFLADRARDWLAPSALLCLFWFGAASLADIAALKDGSLQRPWEIETYAAIYLCGLSMFAGGLLQGRQRTVQPIRIEPSAKFRNATTALMCLSIAAVAARLYVFGFSLEQLIPDFGGADLKTDTDAIPGVFYFEIMTPYLSLCAMFELSASQRMSRLRRTALRAYALYAVVIYCVILSASRGTLLVILTGALYLYTQNGRLRFVHLLAIGALIVAAMSGLSFLRMSSESMANSFLGDDLLLTFLSPIYTYVAFNFENFNSLVRADLQPTYVFYALKFVLWPIYKFDYESGAIRLTDFDTLFFNARTFLYPFYHDLGLIGCVLYPGLISLLVSVFRNSVTRNPARIILLMGLQKPIWFAFFGNYFFGELSVFTPLLVLGLLAAAYPRARRPHRSLPTSLPQPLRPGEYTEDSSPDQTMSSSSTSLSILFIAPLPPPLTGHSIADQVLLEGLEGRHRVDVVDLSLGSRHDGSLSLERIRAVLDVLRKVRNRRQGVDVAYLTISESIAGNLKDLLIFRLLRRKVGRIVVHLHGGSFRVAVLERSRLLRRWNASFLSSVDRIVVTGRSHEAIFQGIAAPERLAVVPNFALPALFTTVDAIRRKFADVERVRVLYVSGMDRRKGYARLLDAYLELPPEARSRLRLDFAGRFDDAQEQAAFEAKIAGLADVIYHGVVDGDRKRNLFASAHVFCLPTAYLEGQPLTILEAYASGCVVLTTPQPGILDGFVPGVNGHLISTDDAAPLRACLVALGANPGQALVIALANFDDAQKNYRSDTFCERMIRILEGR